MELTVFSTEFAKDKLDEIFEHYKLKSRSVDVAMKLVNSIIDHAIVLEKQPYIGQLEELLLDQRTKKPNRYCARFPHDARPRQNERN